MLLRFKKNIEQLGFVNGVLYSLNRVFQKFSLPLNIVKYYFVMQKLSDKIVLPPGKGGGIEIVNLPWDVKNHPCPRPIDVINTRYKQGAKCYAAYSKGEFAGCFWYIKRKYKEDEVRCLYELSGSNLVWDFDVFVDSKYRLSLVFLKLWQEVTNNLLNEGVEYSLSRISAFNNISLASHKRMGAKVIGSATFVCVGGFQLTISSLFPFVYFSFHSDQFPIFHFNFKEFGK